MDSSRFGLDKARCIISVKAFFGMGEKSKEKNNHAKAALRRNEANWNGVMVQSCGYATWL